MKYLFISLFIIIMFTVSSEAQDIQKYGLALDYINNSKYVNELLKKIGLSNDSVNICVSSQIVKYNPRDFIFEIVDYEFTDSANKNLMIDSLRKITLSGRDTVNFYPELSFLTSSVVCNYKLYFSNIVDNKIIAELDLYNEPMVDYKYVPKLSWLAFKFLFYIKENKIEHVIEKAIAR